MIEKRLTVEDADAAPALQAKVADLTRQLAEARAQRDALTERMFPIMGGPAIPWAVIAPCERQADRNHRQTLQRLAERGGLSPCEAVAVLKGRSWEKMPELAALAEMLAIVRERQANPRAEAAEAALAEARAERDVAAREMNRHCERAQVAEAQLVRVRANKAAGDRHFVIVLKRMEAAESEVTRLSALVRGMETAVEHAKHMAVVINAVDGWLALRSKRLMGRMIKARNELARFRQTHPAETAWCYDVALPAAPQADANKAL